MVIHIHQTTINDSPFSSLNLCHFFLWFQRFLVFVVKERERTEQKKIFHNKFNGILSRHSMTKQKKAKTKNEKKKNTQISINFNK